MRDKQIRRRFFLLSRLGRDRKEIDAPRVLRLELSLTHSNFGQSRDKGTSKNCPARSTAMKPPLIVPFGDPNPRLQAKRRADEVGEGDDVR